MSKDVSKVVKKDLRKINACLTDRQYEYIETERQRLGIAFADMLRRILDEFLKSNKYNKIEF